MPKKEDDVDTVAIITQISDLLGGSYARRAKALGLSVGTLWCMHNNPGKAHTPTINATMRLAQRAYREAGIYTTITMDSDGTVEHRIERRAVPPSTEKRHDRPDEDPFNI